MKIKTFNTMNLIPIGKVSFSFDRKFRKSSEVQKVWIGEINIMCNTDRKITEETEKALMKMMKEANSDLLTDGHDFFTTRGAVITQIMHGSFNGIKAGHRKEIHELLFG